ncbi:MAG: 1-acyl-sn-glycerol-3-phosphate acyltransferase [Planctomycetes bacterium]|nr:1-acyl-sn-glycerol-3-phosphate acyltransferase [Planctomycetota bacterium]
MRAEDQDRAIAEVVSRVVGGVTQGGSQALERALAETIYHERKRVERGAPSRARTRALAAWDKRRSQLVRGSDTVRRRVLEELVTGFAREVLGNFDPRVHALATRAVPFGLSALLHASSPQQLLQRFPQLGLDDRIEVNGAVEHALALRDKGTLVCVPTHSSNLDSIVLGYGMHEQGFPPLLYGAGLNLFKNPLMGYFMRNLGAYTVDRRKTAPIYKQVLKEYAGVALEFGYHSLFFPGGTRSRSGEVESKLKLGLLGTTVKAYANKLARHDPKPGLFVVPMVLSYELVLEAETLIDDHLQAEGKARYIITDDEFSSPLRVFQFMRGILELDARIYLTLMPPRDPFGNLVDREGRSLDASGRTIDTSRYLCAAGDGPVDDPNRDQEYTRELGQQLTRDYLRGNTVFPTHLVAFAAFAELEAMHPQRDLYRLLRAGAEDESMVFGDLARSCDALRERLLAMEAAGEVRLSRRVRTLDGGDLVVHALRSWGTYHTHSALTRRGDRIDATDRNLLLYYRNRLQGYGLGAS